MNGCDCDISGSSAYCGKCKKFKSEVTPKPTDWEEDFDEKFVYFIKLAGN